MNTWFTAIAHTSIWIIYLTLYAFIWRLPTMTWSESFLREILLLPFKLVLVYTCIGYLVPAFLQRKRYIAFAVFLVCLILGGTILHNLYIHLILPSEFAALQPNEALFDWGRISRRMTYLTSPMLFAFTAVMVVHWFDQKEYNHRISQENLRANLHLLKQQLQPHFLFNTLNSVYSLALQKSDQTPDVILKLSEMMRYLCDQNGHDWVNLKEEINFIRNYLSLEEMRYQDRVRVEMSSSLVRPERLVIPPLILSPFVENAFKHGVVENARESYIRVSISEDENFLSYEVVNSPASGTKAKVPGSGLNNLRSRLSIIYGSSFTMTSGLSGETFVAHLKVRKKYEDA